MKFISKGILYIYTCSTLNFVDNILIEDAMPNKALKYALFKKFKTKIFIIEYFPKIPLEMNFTHPFYPFIYIYIKILNLKF